MRSESNSVKVKNKILRDPLASLAGHLLGWTELERLCKDPKDGELCLHRAKPGESLVEARKDTNVQIVL